MPAAEEVAEYWVAPLAGAWIEIGGGYVWGRRHKSLPSRERGLKSDFYVHFAVLSQSLPSRERGLKLHFSSA